MPVTENLSEFVTRANLRKIESGKKVVEEITEQCKDPMGVNTKLLMRILSENRDTGYGKKYGFSEIHSVEEYQKKVPVTRYDDYMPYINRMVKKGEQNLLCASTITHFNKSSGTMGVPKYIPMSEDAMQQYNMYNGSGPLGVLANAIGDGWINGRSIRLAESTAEEVFLPCGATYGAVSQKMTRQYRDKLKYMYTSPDEALFPKPGTDTKYLHARYALTDENATSFLMAFYSYLIELLRYIENNWEMLVKDIAEGTIDESVLLPEDVRAKLLSEIKPMPERAAELRNIFSRGFCEPFVPKVWKKMKYLEGIGTGGFKIYADMIREKYTGDGIALLKLGISASEGFFSFPYRLNSEDTVLLPNSVFYEFLPLDAEDDFSKIVTIDGLEQGKEYELIITNLSGFYRYRMRDAIKVVSRYENTPTIEFLYRIDQTISIMGEKTTEAALRMAADATAKELGFELVDFSVYPDLKASPVRYQYFMEIGANPQNVMPNVIRMILEKNLSIANPSMGDKVKANICGDTRLNFLQRESYALYHDMMVAKGMASSQIKPVRIISNERQRKFFFKLTAYSAEVMK